MNSSLEEHAVMPAQQIPGVPRWSRMAGALFLAAMFCVNVYRAATQTVTHDEALTYNWYLAGPLGALFDMSANNHILHTLLAKVSVTIFGPSELALRLPTLVGGALSFTALWMLGVRACRSAIPFFLLLALVGLNPLFLDFCCVARGYGLATAFLLWAMVFALRATDGAILATNEPASRRLWLLCSVALGLSLAANLSLLFVDAAVAAFLATSVLRESAKTGAVKTAMRRLWLWLALPGPLIATALWAPLLINAERGHFYVGWPSWREGAGEFIAASLFHDSCGIRSVADHERTPYELLGAGSTSAEVVGWLASVGSILLFVLLAVAVARLTAYVLKHGISSLDASRRLLLLASASTLVTLGTYAILNVARGALYPPDRAIVFLVPLLVLAGVLLPQSASSGMVRQGLNWVGGSIAAIVIVLSAAGIRTTYFRTWRYNAGTRQMVQAMRAAAPIGDVRVASHWIYAPTLEFYRSLAVRNNESDWLRPEQPEAKAGFLIVHPADNPRLDETQWKLTYQDTVSGANLYQRKGQPATMVRREP